MVLKNISSRRKNIFLKRVFKMKKFLLTMLLAFAVMIPTTNVEAGDVPDFAQIGGNYVGFSGAENSTKGYILYTYTCNMENDRDLAEQFVRLVTSSYQFKLSGHYTQDFTKTSNTSWEHWYFDYRGSKYVVPFQRSNREVYACHLEISKYRNGQTGVTHFSIRVADGLSYDGGY